MLFIKRRQHDFTSNEKNSHWWPLLALFLLGLIGGIIYDTGDVLIRLWSRDMGVLPKQLDWLNGIEILHPLKFLWAPVFSVALAFGPWTGRRAWILMVLGLVICTMVGISYTPVFGVPFLVILLIMTVARASYDVLIIASQMDAVSKSLWGWSENSCVTGYRVGIMLTSNLALRASFWGMSWPMIYGCIGMILMVSMLFIGYSPLFRFLNTVQTAPETSSKKRGFWSSIQDWLGLRGSMIVILFLTIYRLQDGLIDPQREYFLLDTGLTKISLAYLKTCGLFGTIAGGVAAGACIRYLGYRKALTLGLMVHGGAGGLMYLSSLYTGLPWWPESLLKTAYCLEQTTKGWSTITIFSFQLLCCHGRNVMTQLSLFSALSDLGMKIISARSGWLAQEFGWSTLMGVAALSGLPALSLIPYLFSRTFIAEKTAPSLPQNTP
jgi:PAT family beta-lactamase induction signal transducer AmpG